MKVRHANQIGEVELEFSEPLRSIEDLSQLNLTVISSELFFGVTYESQLNVAAMQDIQSG